MDGQIITIKQLPIIEERLQLIKAEIDAKTQHVLALDCNDATVKAIKSLRADLNKDFSDLEEKRKEVKRAVMSPYERFEEVYTECVTNIYKQTDAILKGRIAIVENAIKANKDKEVKAYYDEYAESLGIDFVPYKKSGITVTLSASAKKLKEQAAAYLDRIADELKLIATQPQDLQPEILVEYKRTVNVAYSIQTVIERKKAIEEEAERARQQAEQQTIYEAAEARVDEAVESYGEEHQEKAKAVSLYEFEGLGKKPVTESTAGNIIAMSGIPDITIGDTVCAPGAVEPLPFVKISAPTLEMTFSVNDSPYAGREGKFVTSRQLRDRLYRETLKDVSLKVSDTDRDSAFNVAGRGEMSLSILIETMRREGYEFQVSPPRVLYKEIDGKKCEPIERLVVDVPGDCVGSVIEKLGQRKGDLVEMTPVGDRMKVEFLIPARGLFGYRNDFLTDTKGEGIMASVFDSYAPYKGDISRRGMGSLISTETGDSITYGLFNAQERGTLFIGAGVPVYEGMIIGVANRGEDIVVNACRKKQLTNTRASGSDDALRLVPPRQMSLEQCLEFLADDELLEVTPKSLRMRKAILNHEQRMKSLKGKK